MLHYITLRYITLRYIMLCYIMLCYVTLGFCYVLFREPELPEETSRELSDDNESENEPETRHEDIVKRFRALTKDVAPKAISNIASAQERQKADCDRRINPQNVQILKKYI